MGKAVAIGLDDLDTSPRTASRQRGAIRPPAPSAELVPMQFRMTVDFATEFRVEAARRRMKYNELLKAAFQHYIKASPMPDERGGP
jgi:hypothetical protein